MAFTAGTKTFELGKTWGSLQTKSASSGNYPLDGLFARGRNSYFTETSLCSAGHVSSKKLKSTWT
jgi:hypothetical protein